MNRIRSALVVTVAAFAAATASAETVARALVTTLKDGVGLFNVDENHAWTFDKWIVPGYDATSNPDGPRRPVRAVCRDGIIYVADSMTGSATETSNVRKYTLKGEYLGDLCTFEGCIDGMVFSRDGTYLFASKCAEGNKGGLGRYEIATGEWTSYLTHYKGIQQLSVDNAGHLYVAARYTNTWEGSLEVFEIETMTLVKSWHGNSLPNLWGAGWNPDDDKVYVAYTGDQWGVFDSVGERLVPATVANVGIGWCFGVGYVHGKMYYASKNSNIYRMDDVDLKTPTCTFTSVYTGSGWRGDKIAYDVCELAVCEASRQWKFEEAAGAASCAESVAGENPAFAESGLTPGATGGVGRCAFFTGARSRAVLADSETLVPATADFTVAFWAGLPSGNAVRHLFSNATGAAGDFAVIANADDTLGLSFTPVGASAAVSIATDGVVADGAWHHVAVCRRGTTLELYLDGTRLGTVTVAATDAIARNRSWHCGSNALATEGFVGAGAFLDELSFFETSLLPGEIETICREAKPTEVPTAPILPTAFAPLASSLGNEIAHAFSREAPFGAPGFMIVGGVWYVCADRANERHAADQATRVWKSSDRGATWIELASLPGSGISLFASGATPAAIGLKADGTGRTIAIWTFADDVWTEAATTTYASGTLAASSAAVAAIGGKIWKAVSYRDAGGKYYPACVTASTSGFADLSIGVRTEGKGNPAGFVRANAESSTLADVPGGTVTEWTDHSHPVAIYSFVDRKASGAGQPTGVERAWYQVMETSTAGFHNHYLDMFRGGAKAFTVRYDATSGLYWAVTAPVVDSSRLLTESADQIADRLSVYTSPDLMAWTPCGEILAPVASAGFIPGVFEIDGDDLIVSYAVAADDGAGGVRRETEGNYLAWKRISGFRTALSPAAMDEKRFALLCDGEPAYNDYDYYAPKLVRRYYATADGEWQPGGVFVDATSFEVTSGGVAYKLAVPSSPVVRGSSIFILAAESNPIRIFEFGWRGNFKRLIVDPDQNALYARAMDFTPDGSSAIIVTRNDPTTKVVKMDLATGALTTLVDDATGLANAFRVTVATNGSFYVSSYDWKNPYGRHYAADGTLLGTISKAPNYMTTMNYDAVRHKVYCGDIYGSVRTVDGSTLANEGMVTSRTISNRAVNFHSYLLGDCLYLGSEYGFLSVFDVATGVETAPFATLNSIDGVTVYEKRDRGLMLIVR